MTENREGSEARLARLEAQNRRLTALAERLVAVLVDRGIMDEDERDRLPAR